MEDDIDIYADLPSLNLYKNEQLCNCEELKKELNLLMSKFEDIQKIKRNLENNLSSLLKTAKTEIARKDKMIDELRKRLDDATFKRNNKNESMHFSAHRLSHQHTIAEKYENVSSLHSQESKTELHQTELHHDTYKNRKLQHVDRMPTVFGERLHKRIMKNDKEERKQIATLKLNLEVNAKEIPEENIMESDKENGAQFDINNSGNECNITTTRSSSSEIPHIQNSEKKPNQEDDMHGNKRLKTEDKIAAVDTDYNYIMQYDLKDNLAQYEIKDNPGKFEDRQDATHSSKREQIPFDTRHRAASEHDDTKQDQDCTNRWKKEKRSDSTKDRGNSHMRRTSTDNLRNSWTAFVPNHAAERFNNGYKKDGYRYSPPRRSYSRSRSDYENSSSHRLRERSNRTYRDEKYGDYKYNSRYRDYDSRENNSKTRYSSRMRGDFRNKSKYSLSDVEDKEYSSYKNKKYESLRIKEITRNVLDNKRPHENDKTTTEINFPESSSQSIVNTMNYSARKNVEQHGTKNEQDIRATNSKESISCIAIKDSSNLEQGEILDNPEKKNNFEKISKDEMKENGLKIISVKNKKEYIFMDASIHDKPILLQNDIISTKQLDEVVDTNRKKIDAPLHLLQTNSKDYEKIMLLNSFSKKDTYKNNTMVDEMRNSNNDDNTCKSHFDEELTDSILHSVGTIKQLHDDNINNDGCKNYAEEKLQNSITETTIKIKKMDNLNTENESEEGKMNNPNIERVIKIAENNFNSDNNTEKTNDEELRISTAKVIIKDEVVLNSNTENRDKSQVRIRSEISNQMINAKTSCSSCLSDHNYVQEPIGISNLDAVQKTAVSSECCKFVPETTILQEAKAKEMVNVRSVVDVRKTMLSMVKNKKEQQSKRIVISRRRRTVTLSDSDASMTVIVNANIEKTSPVVDNRSDNESVLKPRACKVSRASVKAACK